MTLSLGPPTSAFRVPEITLAELLQGTVNQDDPTYMLYCKYMLVVPWSAKLIVLIAQLQCNLVARFSFPPHQL